MAVISFQIINLNQSRRTRLDLHSLAQSLAEAFGSVTNQLAQIEELPHVLKELGVGGVQLMPQKTVQESIVEHIFNIFAKKRQENQQELSAAPIVEGSDATQESSS